MNNTGDDRRVRKTKKALRQGLVALLAQKNLKDISVRELTDAVDLHRGTFYVHYRDIYELYDRMWQEMIEEIREIFRQYPAEELSGKPAPLFRAIMEYAWDNQDLCQAQCRPGAGAGADAPGRGEDTNGLAGAFSGGDAGEGGVPAGLCCGGVYGDGAPVG